MNLLIKENDIFGKIRFVEVKNKPYAVAKDVATILGYSNPRDAISRHCKGVVKHDSFKEGGHLVALIPEGDIYRLIIKSKLPQAQKFEEWVMEEVLPEIRKHGMFISENVTKEEIDEYSLYGKYRLRKNFRLAENKQDFAMRALQFHSKDTKDYVHAINAMREEINSVDLSQLKGSEMLQLRELSEDLVVLKNKRENRSYGTKLGKVNKKVELLEDKVEELTPLPPIYDYQLNEGYLSYNICVQGLMGDIKAKKRYNCWKLSIDNELAKFDFSNMRKNSTIELSGCIHSLADVSNLHKAFIDRLVKRTGIDDLELIVIFNKDDISRSTNYKDHYIRIKIYE